MMMMTMQMTNQSIQTAQENMKKKKYAPTMNTTLASQQCFVWL